MAVLESCSGEQFTAAFAPESEAQARCRSQADRLNEAQRSRHIGGSEQGEIEGGSCAHGRALAGALAASTRLPRPQPREKSNRIYKSRVSGL